ncbi:polyphosphate:AMP phosphotransferase [Nibricoccus aquaticus]|uniref:Polyphosphate:AMP phosphotransferase n=1 Tax=Nibricoccus aquaticus TaxID=2576891 RepID=A0A290Q7A3_9BACT|nr:polyphosphate:AMP phosphotransferase [Nibricoccus aquaticus]ATC64147.1 polyphosphate:AMP phosphotransferase [Nibricoccus aquaticus]
MAKPSTSAAPRLSKKDYEARAAVLREKLVQLQVRLKEAPFKILLIVAGVEGAGTGDLLNTLGSWLDPRGVETFSFRDPSDEERERPFLWRFWRSLPTNGRIGIYAGSWYTETLRAALHEPPAQQDLSPEFERIRHFEKLHADDGTLIIKVWLNLSKTAQGRRLRALSSDESTAWRVSPDHWQYHRHYARLSRLAISIHRATHRPHAPWTILDAEDDRARDLDTASLLIARFQAHLRKHGRPLKTKAPSAATRRSLRPAGLKRLQSLPLDQQLSAADYEAKREKWLGKLNQAVRTASAAKRSIVFAFEGWDAAGKGGAIRRLTSAIDVRDYRVIPVAKPTDEEKAHHYLWRFWRNIPRAGLTAIFDRSWYGRVLVERLEGFARDDEWKRAYAEINDFEQQLTARGIIVVKFWLHIGRDEQLRRFRAREETTYKRHKINDEDWRNRRKWDAYEVAVGDMLALTDTTTAPWHLIPANNKRHARLQILKTACKQIETALA